MERIEVRLGERSYDILIESGMLSSLGVDGAAARAAKLAGGAKIAFVTDENVWACHGAAFFDTLKKASEVDAFAVVIPAGEASKNLGQLGQLAAAFAENGLTRDGLVCAFGGGVVGDLAGFAAAAWMRGVRYIQIPTTLLAATDSSVGGKTAVDIPSGKNLLGAFHQPSLVMVDPDCLKTLPAREFRSGMAEVIKYGALASLPLFEKLEALSDLRARQESLLREADFCAVIAACVKIKAEIVAEDELDTGRRALLNLGHTFGHAIETKYGFSKYTHGEAVAIGMRIAARYGESVRVTKAGTATRLSALLDAWGLSETEPTSELAAYIKNDKKSKGALIHLILLRRIGEAFVHAAPFAELEEQLAAL